ncbi:MAG: TrkA C-terminal domain-containing protein, partial [Thermomicrobiales bacterium]
ADLSIVEASIDEHSPIANQTLDEIELPVDCVIAAIARGVDVIVPRGTTRIEPGDEVIAITHRTEEDELRRLLVDE